MRSIILQDWTTVRGDGPGGAPVAQARPDWLDVGPYADAVFWIEVANVTDPGGGVSLLLETAPVAEEALFVPVDSVAVLSASATPLVRKAFLNGVGGAPIARFLRWKIKLLSGSGAWGVTFRIHVSLGEGARNAFCPLGLAKLVLWMRADLGVTLVAGTNKVSQWDDQSGLSNRFAVQATDASRPIWTANAIGGRPALDFSGSKFLENQFSNVISGSGGTKYSVLIVAKNGSGALFTLRRSTQYSATKFHLSVTYAHGDGVNPGANMVVANSLAQTQSSVNAFKSAHVYQGTAQPALVTLNTASWNPSSGAQTVESGSTGFQIGTNAASEFWNGLIAEIIVVDEQISDADRLRVERYQRDFFGVQP